MEDRELKPVIEDRCRDFIGREAILDELVGLATSPAQSGAPWGMCVTGPAGAGKTALFAKLHYRLKDRNVHVISHAAGVGLRSIQIDVMLRQLIDGLVRVLKFEEMIVEDASWEDIKAEADGPEGIAGLIAEMVGIEDVSDPLPMGASADDVEVVFEDLLNRASKKRRIVVLIDALDQFQGTLRSRHLSWIPRQWPANARLIATAIPGSQSEALSERPGATIQELPLLSTIEAADIARAVCGRYHRTINPAVLEALIERRREDGEPAAGNPLWLELAVEALNLLDADDFERLDRDFEGTPEERLHQLLLATITEFPADIAALYGWLLGRAEELHGEAWARAFVALIAVSRAGWRETDLQALMPTVSGEAWDDLKFAALRRTFRAHVVQRGAQAQWDFSHNQMREAVRRQALGDEDEGRRLHAALADHLLALSANDSLHESETMVHLMGADDRPRAVQYYGGELTEGERAGATAVLAEGIVAGQDEEINSKLEWTIALLDEPEMDDTVRATLCNRFIFDLEESLQTGALLGTRRKLDEAVGGALDSLTRRDPSNADLQRDLAVSHEKIGDVQRTQGDMLDALTAYRRAIEVTECLARTDPSHDQGYVLSECYGRIGEVLLVKGDRAGALQAYQAGIKAGLGIEVSDVKRARETFEDISSFHDVANMSGRVRLFSSEWQLRRLIDLLDEDSSQQNILPGPLAAAIASRQVGDGDSKTQPLDCSIFAPPALPVGKEILVQVFLHPPELEDQAERRARVADEHARPRGFTSLSIDLAVGTKVGLELRVPGLIISDEGIGEVRWNDRVSGIQFLVHAPIDCDVGPKQATLIISAGGIPTGRIHFQIEIKTKHETAGEPEPQGDAAKRYSKAFISYASEDRTEVLKRVQLLGAFKIDYFQDLMSLDPGSRWKQELFRNIDDCDLFLLFWSSAARNSEWVCKEALYAIDCQSRHPEADPDIVPVIIEGPPPAEPPPKLAHLHFNDRFLYFFRE